MSDLLERAAKVIAPTLGMDTDLVALSSDGVEVRCDNGKTYYDFASGTAVLNIGHGPAKVKQAAKRQIDQFIHSGCVFHYESLVRLAELLAEVTPQGIGKFFFSNSGAEAVEGCLKLARYVTGRPGIVSFTGAFHGRTLGAASVTTSSVKYRTRYGPLLPEVYQVPFPYCYRCPYGLQRESCGLQCFEALLQFQKHVLAPSETAAFLIEPQQGEGGYVPCDPEFMTRLRELCDEQQVLLIFDEVQTGFGRTCKWFCAEHYGVTPDAMAIAKGIAGGFPLSAVAARPELMDRWSRGAHGTTFGGSPVSCAAGVALIETIREQNLLEQGMKKAEHVRQRLAQMQAELPLIGDVRGWGMMIGIELVQPGGKQPNPEALNKVLADALEQNFVMISCGPSGNVIRYIPPLVAPLELIDRSLDIIEHSLRKQS
ncbi:MAG: aminotransferase class III-fold pyridoxal phosphate-dependent enzyme [Candidatus Alcyoniella australis]|nr:aminotransferase class III-fold pyridoxal phosphate-dependent enzyme [Candidatus Alcyoniella australis]